MHTLLKTSDTVGRVVNFRTKMLDRGIIDTWQRLNKQLRHSLPQLDRCEQGWYVDRDGMLVLVDNFNILTLMLGDQF